MGSHFPKAQRSRLRRGYGAAGRGQSPRFRLGELYSSERRLRPLAKRSGSKRRTSNIEHRIVGGARRQRSDVRGQMSRLRRGYGAASRGPRGHGKQTSNAAFRLVEPTARRERRTSNAEVKAEDGHQGSQPGMSVFSRSLLALSVSLAGCFARSRRTPGGERYVDAKRFDH